MDKTLYQNKHNGGGDDALITAGWNPDQPTDDTLDRCRCSYRHRRMVPWIDVDIPIITMSTKSSRQCTEGYTHGSRWLVEVRVIGTRWWHGRRDSDLDKFRPSDRRNTLRPVSLVDCIMRDKMIWDVFEGVPTRLI